MTAQRSWAVFFIMGGRGNSMSLVLPECWQKYNSGTDFHYFQSNQMNSRRTSRHDIYLCNGHYLPLSQITDLLPEIFSFHNCSNWHWQPFSLFLQDIHQGQRLLAHSFCIPDVCPGCDKPSKPTSCSRNTLSASSLADCIYS